jgi:hypothetical protein
LAAHRVAEGQWPHGRDTVEQLGCGTYAALMAFLFFPKKKFP